ncbi:MAG: FtsW/RodA/SpoVE family cell cycle protein [Oscillospiraceae bacterium]|jgi:cell division protein FtsW (lipid II flippase)|nr:FtsW/RodA/SpoVE family cell cycle protein [Oscillospiraceae bacterium]
MPKQAIPRARPRAANRSFHWVAVLLAVTVFQLLSFAPLLLQGAPELPLLLALLCYPAGEWLFLLALRAAGQKNLAPELLACWLSGLSLAVCGSISAEYAWKQAVAIGGGMLVYGAVRFCIANADRAMQLRPAVALAAGGLLAANLVLAQTVNGQRNWITLGGFSIQPSELVKLAFVFVGGATLEKLQRAPSITRYLVFAMGCVGALFLMKDFGTALIFFAAFLVIAFLRSGDLRTIGLVLAAAALGAALIIYFRPYVASRFQVYRHIWQHIHDTGYQQTRVLIYASSGGLFGLGLGQGRLRNVFAASTDLPFGLLCEEFGMLIAFLAALCYVAFAVYAMVSARHVTSAFYAIASISAAAMYLIQAGLNIFGVTDLLPLTGVTLPFISRGGTSMLCAWGLLAFIAASPRPQTKAAPQRAAG